MFKANYVIGQAPLTITAANQTKTYGFGGTNAALGTTGYTITGGTLKGSDAISGVTLSTSDALSTGGYYDATNGTPAGLTAASAVFSSGLAGNYAITYDNATTGLIVSRAPLNIVANNVSRAPGAKRSHVHCHIQWSGEWRFFIGRDGPYAYKRRSYECDGGTTIRYSSIRWNGGQLFHTVYQWHSDNCICNITHPTGTNFSCQSTGV